MSADSLSQPDLYANGDPWAVWKALRANEPVSRTREEDGPGFWSVVTYAEGLEVLRDWRTYRSARGTTIEGDRWTDDPASGRMLPLLDPPVHDRLRRALAPVFAPQRLAAAQADCLAFLDGLLDRCCDQIRFDVSDAIGTPLPMHVSLRMLGVPEADDDFLRPIVRGTLSVDETERAAADAELLMYLAELIAARRRSPQADALSALMAIDLDGVPLSDEMALLTFTNLFSAGLTTTRLAINGAIHALCAHPDQWRLLRDRPDALSSAVEEVIRWTSPALAVARTVEVPTTLAGRTLAAQDRVAVWLPSLNRDERAFAEPDVFRVDRSPNRHIGFGVGVHTCLGMALARIELKALLAALPRRWSSLAASGPPTFLASLVLHGVDRLPIEIVAA